jgi:putative salt-induced outer membrane protein YdiY
MQRGAAVVAFVALGLCTATAGAQVNVEPLRRSLETKPVSALLSGSFNATSGNSQGATANTSGQVAGASGKHFAFATARADYARYNGTTNIARSFFHVRYNYQLGERFWGEAFGQLQSDQFQRLIARNLWGIGPRIAIYRDDEFSIFFGTAYMFEYNRIRPAPGSTDPKVSTAHRSSNYIAISYQVTPSIVAGTTAYIQPTFVDLTNARMLVEASATFKITTHLASSLSYIVRYDSRAPDNVKPTDTELRNSIALIF